MMRLSLFLNVLDQWVIQTPKFSLRFHMNLGVCFSVVCCHHFLSSIHYFQLSNIWVGLAHPGHLKLEMPKCHWRGSPLSSTGCQYPVVWHWWKEKHQHCCHNSKLSSKISQCFKFHVWNSRASFSEFCPLECGNSMQVAVGAAARTAYFLVVDESRPSKKERLPEWTLHTWWCLGQLGSLVAN